MTQVGRWGQWFTSTLVYRSSVVQPLSVCILTSPWCRQNIFLAVFHEADLVQPFPTSLSSPVADLPFCRCVWTVSTSVLSGPLWCIVSMLFHRRSPHTEINRTLLDHYKWTRFENRPKFRGSSSWNVDPNTAYFSSVFFRRHRDVSANVFGTKHVRTHGQTDGRTDNPKT